MKEFWQKYKSEIALAVLVVYTLGLGVAVADELFHLGIFPPKLDRLIAEAIEKFDDPDTKVSEQAFSEIIEYGNFAVPLLVDALDHEGRTRDLAIKALQQITDQKFTDVNQWREWYSEHKSEYL